MKSESLNEKDRELIKMAKSLAKKRKVFSGTVGDVGCALRTKKGKIFTGISIDLSCGLGFCAERAAMANMLTHSDETEIDTIAASGANDNDYYPCGSCREFMELINVKNRDNTWVITTNTQKVKLKELLPGEWF